MPGMFMWRTCLGTLKLEQFIRCTTRSETRSSCCRRKHLDILPLSLVRVITLSLAGVKDETTCAGDGVGDTINAEVELVADACVLMREVTMLSGTSGGGLGWLQV